MDDKYVAIIEGKTYRVGYPQCAGCENLCIPFPASCIYPGEGCEYPKERVESEQQLPKQ
jgi:hypothetical protein